MSYCLWEIAKKRNIQQRLRAEITETLERIRARGDNDFSVNDFDSMPYLVAVGKVRLQSVRMEPNGGLIPRSVQEALRLHPAAIEVQREATKDDVLPLTKPIVGVSGKVYKELPVPAGTLVFISMAGYNLYVYPLVTLPRRPDLVVKTGFYHFAGTKICGDQMPTSSDQNGGWTRTKSLKRRSGFMATCT